MLFVLSRLHWTFRPLLGKNRKEATMERVLVYLIFWLRLSSCLTTFLSLCSQLIASALHAAHCQLAYSARITANLSAHPLPPWTFHKLYWLSCVTRSCWRVMINRRCWERACLWTVAWRQSRVSSDYVTHWNLIIVDKEEKQRSAKSVSMLVNNHVQNTPVASKEKNIYNQMWAHFITKRVFGLFGASMCMLLTVQSCLTLKTQILTGVLTKQSLNVSNVFVVCCTATGVPRALSCRECVCQRVCLISTSEACLDCSHLIHPCWMKSSDGKNQAQVKVSAEQKKQTALNAALCWGAFRSLRHTNQIKYNIL